MGCLRATGILGEAAIERTSCPTQSPAAAPAPLAPALEDAHVQNDGELPFPCGVTPRKHQPWKRPPSLGFLDTSTMLRLQSLFRLHRSPEGPTSVRGCSAMPQNRENPSPAQLGTEAGGAQEISIHQRLVTSQTGAKPTIFFQLPSKLEFLETCGRWGKRSARGVAGGRWLCHRLRDARAHWRCRCRSHAHTGLGSGRRRILGCPHLPVQVGKAGWEAVIFGGRSNRYQRVAGS